MRCSSGASGRESGGNISRILPCAQAYGSRTNAAGRRALGARALAAWRAHVARASSRSNEKRRRNNAGRLGVAMLRPRPGFAWARSAPPPRAAQALPHAACSLQPRAPRRTPAAAAVAAAIRRAVQRARTAPSVVSLARSPCPLPSLVRSARAGPNRLGLRALSSLCVCLSLSLSVCVCVTSAYSWWACGWLRLAGGGPQRSWHCLHQQVGDRPLFSRNRLALAVHPPIHPLHATKRAPTPAFAEEKREEGKE